MRELELFENQIFEKMLAKWDQEQLLKTENEEVKGGGTWSKVAMQ